MADEASNDDQWLYGDSIDLKDESTEQGELTEPAPEKEPAAVPESLRDVSSDAPPGTENDEPIEQTSQEAVQEDDDKQDDKNEGELDDDDEDDDSDDDVNVVIGDIKTTAYSSLNIKRGGLLTSVGIDKIGGKQPGKFSIEEFEQIGTINGQLAHEFNLDSLEEKPWRKPGADITDYFNYGFNEETWRAYCERQKRMRVHESGVGLGPLGSSLGGTGTGQSSSVRPGSIPVAIVNDNSKYAAALGMRKAGPPPGRKVAGSIDVIGSGGGTLASRRTERDTPPKENVIQVMTADRREYSRKSSFPDMSVPPPAPAITPAFDIPPPLPVPSPFPPVPPPTSARMHPGPYGQQEFYSPDTDPYYQSFEPTQEQQQWSNHQDSFTAREEGLPGIPSVSSVKVKDDAKSSPKASSSGRDTRERDRERDREKHRSLSGIAQSSSRQRRSHRHRSRSRSPGERERERKSRRHKSRSRSPGHRSHRKKKSKKSDKSKEDDSD